MGEALLTLAALVGLGIGILVAIGSAVYALSRDRILDQFDKR